MKIRIEDLDKFSEDNLREIEFKDRIQRKKRKQTREEIKSKNKPKDYHGDIF